MAKPRKGQGKRGLFGFGETVEAGDPVEGSQETTEEPSAHGDLPEIEHLGPSEPAAPAAAQAQPKTAKKAVRQGQARSPSLTKTPSKHRKFFSKGT